MVKSMTLDAFRAQFSNFLSGPAQVPVIPGAWDSGAVGYTFPDQMVRGAVKLPPPLLTMPHIPITTQHGDFLQRAIIDRAKPVTGRPMEDAPSVKVEEGRQLTTFVDQATGLQMRVDKYIAIQTDELGNDPRASEGIAQSLQQGVSSDLFHRGGDFLLSAMVLSATASSSEVSSADYEHFTALAAMTFADAADIFFNMRYHSAAAMTYEMAIHDGYRFISLGRRDASVKLQKWEDRTALSWHNSRLAEDDPVTNSVKVMRGIFHGWKSADTRTLHNLLLRSAKDHAAKGFHQESAADYFRMAWNRLERAKVSPVRNDWTYIPQMIDRALDIWRAQHIFLGETIGEGQRLADVARMFYD
ncbi:MAG: hypothetical protein HN337_02690 [Deltaproteobacteria bacterium]|jgi:hypothetical protein|nr:hypothetical protein [Deltaproteobacteria bacterium]